MAVVDVSARLDVNVATRPHSRFLLAIHRSGVRRRLPPRFGEDRFRQSPTSGDFRPRSATLIRSLDELHQRSLVPEAILTRAVPYLTVDGDGVINARTASDTVLVAATGELRDEPSRLLLVSRGWVSGSA